MDVLLQRLWYFCHFCGLMLGTASARGLPTVDPGLFVISGVGTCGEGNGYCLLGSDCTLDEDFIPDDQNGHCDGLKSAFTPSAHFVCCKDTNRTSNKPVVTLPRPVSTIPDQNENEIDHVIAKLEQSVISFKEAHLKNSSFNAGLVQNKDEDEVNEFRPEVSTLSEVTTDATTEEVTTGISEIEDMTESTEEVKDPSLKSDEAYGTEGSLHGDAEWMDSKELPMKNAKKNESTIRNETPEMNDVGVSIFQDTEQTVTDKTQGHESANSIGADDQGQTNTEIDIGNTSTSYNTNGSVENQFDMTKPTMVASNINATRDKVNQRPDKSKDPEQPSGQEIPDSGSSQLPQPPPTDTTLTSPAAQQCGMSARCIGLVRFQYQNTPLCYGNPIFDDWIITSASCALRIFRMGMFNVSVSPDKAEMNENDRWLPNGSVKTIIIHENYRAMENQLHLDVNNIGIIKVDRGLGWDLCKACLPQQFQKFEGERCASYPLPPDSSQRNTVLRFRYHEYRTNPICEGTTELLPGTGDFLSIPCLSSTWAPRSVGTTSNGVGLPLRCDGTLAGIQTAEGIGTRVYTPVSSYIKWIEENTMQQSAQPMQTFRHF